MSQSITGSRYKPSEVIQLPFHLTICGSLGKKISKNRVSELELEEWSGIVMNDTSLVFF